MMGGDEPQLDDHASKHGAPQSSCGAPSFLVRVCQCLSVVNSVWSPASSPPPSPPPPAPPQNTANGNPPPPPIHPARTPTHASPVIPCTEKQSAAGRTG